MPVLPNPFESALEPARVADDGRCPGITDPPVAAADSLYGVGPCMPAVRELANTMAGATDDIHEIFYHARKLIAEEHRFVLDEAAFMEAIEPPPLFLQRRA